MTALVAVPQGGTLIPKLPNRANQVCFYDLETTTDGDKEIIEFGAVVLDKHGWYEVESYSTLIRSDAKVTPHSIKINGITEEMLHNAPTFAQVADHIQTVLEGRLWAGHNIVTFDNKELERAFQRIGRPMPPNAGVLDTLPLIREHYGPRAPSFSLANLALHFGLGSEKHRAMDDCRLAIQVLMRCCTSLFLERFGAPDLFKSPTLQTRGIESKTPGRSPKGSPSLRARRALKEPFQSPMFAPSRSNSRSRSSSPAPLLADRRGRNRDSRSRDRNSSRAVGSDTEDIGSSPERDGHGHAHEREPPHLRLAQLQINPAAIMAHRDARDAADLMSPGSNHSGDHNHHLSAGHHHKRRPSALERLQQFQQQQAAIEGQGHQNQPPAQNQPRLSSHPVPLSIIESVGGQEEPEKTPKAAPQSGGPVPEVQLPVASSAPVVNGSASVKTPLQVPISAPVPSQSQAAAVVMSAAPTAVPSVQSQRGDQIKDNVGKQQSKAAGNNKDRETNNGAATAAAKKASAPKMWSSILNPNAAPWQGGAGTPEGQQQQNQQGQGQQQGSGGKKNKKKEKGQNQNQNQGKQSGATAKKGDDTKAAAAAAADKQDQTVPSLPTLIGDKTEKPKQTGKITGSWYEASLEEEEARSPINNKKQSKQQQSQDKQVHAQVKQAQAQASNANKKEEAHAAKTENKDKDDDSQGQVSGAEADWTEVGGQKKQKKDKKEGGSKSEGKKKKKADHAKNPKQPAIPEKDRMPSALVIERLEAAIKDKKALYMHYANTRPGIRQIKNLRWTKPRLIFVGTLSDSPDEAHFSVFKVIAIADTAAAVKAFQPASQGSSQDGKAAASSSKESKASPSTATEAPKSGSSSSRPSTAPASSGKNSSATTATTTSTSSSQAPAAAANGWAALAGKGQGQAQSPAPQPPVTQGQGKQGGSKRRS